MPTLQAALERLTDNAALTGDLTDDEARALLAWGKDQVALLHARALPEETFDAQFDALSALLLHMNSAIGAREVLTPEQQQIAMTRIRDAAAELGLRTDWLDHEAEAISAQAAEDKIAAIRSMTARLTRAPAPDADLPDPAAQIASVIRSAAQIAGAALAQDSAEPSARPADEEPDDAGEPE